MGPAQPVQELIHSGHEIPIKAGDLVKPSKVITEAESAILFQDYNDGTGPRATGCFYYLQLTHPRYLLLYSQPASLWYPVGPLLKTRGCTNLESLIV